MVLQAVRHRLPCFVQHGHEHQAGEYGEKVDIELVLKLVLRLAAACLPICAGPQGGGVVHEVFSLSSTPLLKVADVGLVGYPNAGKSSLLVRCADSACASGHSAHALAHV